MAELRFPLDALREPCILKGEKAPRDYGVGRRCAECGCKVNRYSAPQPKTNLPLCGLHWKIPDGYQMTSSGVSKEI